MGIFRRPQPLDPKPASGCSRPPRDFGGADETLFPFFAALFVGFVIFGLGVLAGALAF